MHDRDGSSEFTRYFEPSDALVETFCSVPDHERFVGIARQSSDGWQMVAVMPIVPSDDSLSLPAVTTAVPAVALEGLRIGPSYPGCPFCGDHDLFRCGCGTVSCQGSVDRSAGRPQIYCPNCKKFISFSDDVPGRFSGRGGSGYAGGAASYRPPSLPWKSAPVLGTRPTSTVGALPSPSAPRLTGSAPPVLPPPRK